MPAANAKKKRAQAQGAARLDFGASALRLLDGPLALGLDAVPQTIRCTFAPL
jgi:hypothetical protein